jgi:Lon protease-like protein
MKPLLSIPLFPLNTVLFPGQLLPLHIFEPRYQVMIKECIAEDSVFGVVLIHHGSEVGEAAEPYLVGTTARIKQVDQLSNGTIDLICSGEKRFRIRSLSEEHPYLSGKIELWPWVKADPAFVHQGVSVIRLQLTNYLKTLTRLTGSTLEIGDLPTDPIKITSLAAIALRISNLEKQNLLATDQIQELMERCLLLLKREIYALKTFAAIPEGDVNPSSYYSPN